MKRGETSVSSIRILERTWRFEELKKVEGPGCMGEGGRDGSEEEGREQMGKK